MMEPGHPYAAGASRRERWHLRVDPALRQYVATIVALLADRPEADVLDIAAGTGWIATLGFGSYQPLDITGVHERWDINTPLPDHHVGRYDVAVCLGALHFALDPRAALAEFVRAVKPGGEIVVGVPWLYPPHDREVDAWRLSPRLLWRLLDEHFETVDLYPNGSVLNIPTMLLNRFVSGPFRGVDADELARLRTARRCPRWSASAVDEVPVHWLGPLGVIGHARNPR